MGVAFYPVFEDGSGGWSLDINGKCLARAADKFDKPCKKASVPTLYDFYSMTRDQLIAELLDGDPDDRTSYDEKQLPEETWYDSAAGLVTVRFLLEFVRSNADCFDEYQCVFEDLEEFERQLTHAIAKSVRWHLVIDT